MIEPASSALAGKYAQWSDKPQTAVPGQRRLSPTLQALITFSAVFVLCLACTYVEFGGAWLLWIFGLPASTIGVYQKAKGKLRLEREREVLQLADQPGGFDQYFVHVNLYALSALYGEDDGVLSLLGGMAHFVGLETQFTLAKRHNLSGFWRDRYEGAFVVYRARFRNDGFTGDAEILIRMNQSFEDPFEKGFKAWNQDPHFEPLEEIVEPPIKVSPLSMRKAYRQALTAEILGILDGAAFALVLDLLLGWIWAVAFLAVVWALCDLASRPYRQLLSMEKGLYKRARITIFRKPMILIALQRALASRNRQISIQQLPG